MLGRMTGHPSDPSGALDPRDTATLPATPAEDPQPSWWHRGHPVFAALTGFFAGLVFVVVVPGAYAAVLAALMDYEAAEELFPFVLVTLAVPIALLVHPLTRRFARYMLLGIYVVYLVVICVAPMIRKALRAQAAARDDPMLGGAAGLGNSLLVPPTAGLEPATTHGA